MMKTLTKHNTREDQKPDIEFGLRKDGEMDEKFSLTLTDEYGPLNDSHPFANYLDRVVATAITHAHNKKRRQGCFTSPFLARYALIGHDGRFLYLSRPHEMTAGFTAPDIDHFTITERGEITRYYRLCRVPYFTLMMRVGDLPQQWTGKVERIDIYVSPQAPVPGGMHDHNYQETFATESPFYHIASIDCRRFDQAKGFVCIPVFSTFTPDIEAKDLLDESHAMEDLSVASNSAPFTYKYPIIDFLASASINPTFHPERNTRRLRPLLHKSLYRASGLSPPLR